MTQVVAEDSTVNTVKPANGQVLTKIFTFGPQLPEDPKSSFFVNENEFTHKIIDSEEDFLSNLSFHR